VPDLYEVINFNTIRQHRLTESCAVDGRVGANLHVAACMDNAYLGNSMIARSVAGEAESVGAYNSARVEDVPWSDHTSFPDNDALVKDAIAFDAGVCANANPCLKDASLSDRGSGSDGTEGPHLGGRMHRCRGVDSTGRMNSVPRAVRRIELVENICPGKADILRPEGWSL
jgi:hypothetical protein